METFLTVPLALMNYCGAHPLQTELRKSRNLTLKVNVRNVLPKWVFQWFCSDRSHYFCKLIFWHNPYITYIKRKMNAQWKMDSIQWTQNEACLIPLLFTFAYLYVSSLVQLYSWDFTFTLFKRHLELNEGITFQPSYLFYIFINQNCVTVWYKQKTNIKYQ